jgi:pimeloyl-ACP methyl ester carboxylesterase
VAGIVKGTMRVASRRVLAHSDFCDTLPGFIMQSLCINGHRLEYVRLPSAHPRAGMPPTVFLHEGLGSVGLWRDFPQRMADATGSEAIVYSRIGYGGSDPFAAPRTLRYLHEQALDDLPALIDALALDRPFLFGHSDGGSIALICAGAGRVALSGIVVLAPHVMVEEVTIEGIRAADAVWRSTDLPARLAQHHADAPAVFAAWRDTWLTPEFRHWNIEDCLPAISCPVLAIQGVQDEYATMAQIDRIASGARDVRLLKLADCRHSPHKDQPEAVIEATRAFMASCVGRIVSRA